MVAAPTRRVPDCCDVAMPANCCAKRSQRFCGSDRMALTTVIPNLTQKIRDLPHTQEIAKDGLGGTRTLTTLSGQRILSPQRLPIPPRAREGQAMTRVAPPRQFYRVLQYLHHRSSTYRLFCHRPALAHDGQQGSLGGVRIWAGDPLCQCRVVVTLLEDVETKDRDLARPSKRKSCKERLGGHDARDRRVREGGLEGPGPTGNPAGVVHNVGHLSAQHLRRLDRRPNRRLDLGLRPCS